MRESFYHKVNQLIHFTRVENMESCYLEADGLIRFTKRVDQLNSLPVAG